MTGCLKLYHTQRHAKIHSQMHVHKDHHAFSYRRLSIYRKLFSRQQRSRYNQCFCLKSWSQMVQKLHFPSLCDVPQQVGYRFFFLSSPPTPLGNGERIEKKVMVWSDSQRVALIRSMVEQTVFTDSDREGVCCRVSTVGSCEFNVFACLCICVTF